MELIPHNLNINFVRYKNFFITGSIIVNILILVAAGFFSLNWGVDFKGGTEIEVKFGDSAQGVKDVEVRKAIESAGMGDVTVQVFGPPRDNSFLIRVGRVSLLSPEDASRAKAALENKFGKDLTSFDYNADYGDKFELRFSKLPQSDEIRGAIESAGIHVLPGEQGLRAQPPFGFSVITSGISDKIKSSLAEANQKQLLPSANVQRVEYVGPQVGKQLRTKGILAVIYAAIAILAYVALRFDTRFAPGAVIAMAHDIVVVLGYFVISRREFNLTSVAVLLTIVGYSVNDTIVIYDRIRENMAKVKGMALPQMINMSLNETLARTILTSFATGLSLVGLLLFAVGPIWDFAAAMLLGIVTGTYSSIYIASPVTIWLEEITGKAPAATPATKTS